MSKHKGATFHFRFYRYQRMMLRRYPELRHTPTFRDSAKANRSMRSVFNSLLKGAEVPIGRPW